MNKTAFFIILFLFAGTITSQSKMYSFGASLGGGNISGRTPAIASLASEIFIQVEPPFLDQVYFNLSYSHARKIEYFLPENKSSTYYPFFNIYSGALSLTQPFYGRIMLEESLGYTAINDKTFSTESNWAHGFDFSLFANFIPDSFYDGLVWSLGLRYGVTFSSHTANYFMMLFRVSHRFSYSH
ncbi:MAG: hypothetical protein SCALA702_38060 [Melioribacteraceae bacterium]|nr:MAG: hypothetical protein SCALA702_38060 [Melioribacteraceae bacterium]